MNTLAGDGRSLLQRATDQEDQRLTLSIEALTQTEEKLKIP